MPYPEMTTTTFLAILASVSFFHLLAASAVVLSEHDADRQALLCLKSHLDDPSEALASWTHDTRVTFCLWHGVTCGKRHASRVTALDLESENISGQIFPCIANLTFIVRIHMPNNQLNGHIGPEISRLTRLRYLNLSMNSFMGGIPATISSCSRLEIIDLCGNSLQGEIPSSLSHCSNLQSIFLSDNNLQGSVPAPLALLPNLSALFLPNNQLTGNVPGFLGIGRNLGWLNLRNNSLSGGIPSALFNSTSLSYIDLSHNGISGPISLYSVVPSSSPLWYLSLTQNNLSGNIPASLGNYSNLAFLLLAHNNLQGSIPESLGNLARLTAINLNYNNLSGTVSPGLYNISGLTYLGLGANQLVGKLPTDIGFTLRSITQLILEHNHFGGSLPSSLANASNMQALELRNNAFTGIIPSLGSLAMLTFLDLGVNRLEAGDWSFMHSLSNCSQLQVLWFDRNNLQGKIPDYFANISKSIEVLVLSENQLTGAVPYEIGDFMNLTVLQIHRNFISGHIPETVGNLRQLSILSLSHNKLSGAIPQSIGKLEQLTELYFEENGLTGRIPSSLQGCKHLSRLNLSSNRLEGTIPTELFSLSTLSDGLDLSYNQLSGEIPLEIGRLINLNSLSLSNNKLSGQIPSTLSACLVLDSLRLEANLLQGGIPKTFVSLRGITVMDLSENKLSGQIPEFFQNLSSLQTLNLSFNDLEGPVPRGGVFANSSNVFIQGNSKLCASSPIILELPLCTTSPSCKKKVTSYIVGVAVPLATLVAITTLACVAVIILKKRRDAKQQTNQSHNQFKNFSYADLFQATDGFSPNSLIGSGTFGLVYKGQFTFELCAVAIKVFRLDQLGAPSSFLSECEALRNIRHRNLIRVISLCSTFDPTGNEFKALILQYMGNGNLESWLHRIEYGLVTRSSPLSFGSRLAIAVDISAALDYLHIRCSPPLVHRDLKPSNVLLDNEMVACLGDFGLSKFLSSDSSMGFHNSLSNAGPKGSVGYIAPEYGMGCKASIEGDIYSYGIILLEMVTGKRPTDEMFEDGMNLRKFVQSSLPHNIDEILDPDLTAFEEGVDIGQIVDGIQTCALQLATLGISCSETSPKDRPTTEEAYAEILAIKQEFSSVLYNWGS